MNHHRSEHCRRPPYRCPPRLRSAKSVVRTGLEITLVKSFLYCRRSAQCAGGWRWDADLSIVLARRQAARNRRVSLGWAPPRRWRDVDSGLGLCRFGVHWPEWMAEQITNAETRAPAPNQHPGNAADL